MTPEKVIPNGFVGVEILIEASNKKEVRADDCLYWLSVAVASYEKRFSLSPDVCFYHLCDSLLPPAYGNLEFIKAPEICEWHIFVGRKDGSNDEGV